MKLQLTEEIWREGNMYVSYCPELDISSCGYNIEQAKKSLQEAIQITIEETKKMGTFEDFFDEYGLEIGENQTYSVRKELIGFTSIEIAV